MTQHLKPRWSSPLHTTAAANTAVPNVLRRALTLGPAAILLTGTAACGGGDTSSSTPPSPSDLTTAIEHLISQSQAADAPGLIVALVRRGQGPWICARGLAQQATKIELSEPSTFEAASLSKPFTSLGVMSLVASGQLQLTDFARKYLPELPVSWSSISVHHLLSHQAGIPDYLNRLTPDQLDGKDNKSMLQLYYAAPGLDFMPGTRAAYSNGNYLVLAELIERVSKTPFASYMKTAVFDRFGMTQTQFTGPVTSSALNMGVDRKPYGAIQATLGPIGLVTSIIDLCSFMEKCALNNTFDPTIWTQITKPQMDLDGGITYGYGVFVSRTDDSVAHGGRLDGYRSKLHISRKRGYAIAMLGNGGNSTEALQKQILDMATGSLGIGG